MSTNTHDYKPADYSSDFASVLSGTGDVLSNLSTAVTDIQNSFLSGVANISNSFVSGVTDIQNSFVSGVGDITTIISGSASNVSSLVTNITGDASTPLGIPSIGVGYKNGGRYSSVSASETVVFQTSQKGFLFVQANGDASLSAPGIVNIYDGAQDSEHLIMQAVISAGSSQLISAYPYQSLINSIVTITSDGTNPVSVSIGFYTNAYSGVQTYVTGIDTYLYNSGPNNKYGSSSITYVGRGVNQFNTNRGLIQFDLSAIPSTYVVGQALLRLYSSVTLANQPDFSIYRCLRTWVELEATWNNYSTGNAWSAAGGDIGVDYAATPEISQNVDWQSGQTNTFDITNLVQKWINGSITNQGVMLKANESLNNSMVYLSTFSSGVALQKPGLLITFV